MSAASGTARGFIGPSTGSGIGMGTGSGTGAGSGMGAGPGTVSTTGSCFGSGTDSASAGVPSSTVFGDGTAFMSVFTIAPQACFPFPVNENFSSEMFMASISRWMQHILTNMTMTMNGMATVSANAMIPKITSIV